MLEAWEGLDDMLLPALIHKEEAVSQARGLLLYESCRYLTCALLVLW